MLIFEKFAILLVLTIGLGLVDIVMGLLKAYICEEKFTSDKMSKGLVKKVANVIGLSTFIGVDYFLAEVGNYPKSPKFAYIFFIYIVIMEFQSLGENYKAITGSNALIDTFQKVIKSEKENKENDT